jgi:iron complex outermembrane receptor protein
MITRSVFFTAAALVTLLMLSTPGLTQTSPTGASSTDIGGTLQEVTVFAQKRTESLESVPIAVTALSNADIANWRLDNSNDLQLVTPNLTTGSVYQGVTPQLTLRGVGVNDGIATTSPSVGTYIDQIYMQDSAAAVITMFDLQRVEVLRGPQGTLYGKNTNGGALNFYSQRPTEDFSAEMALEAGNYSERSGSAYFSGPLAGSVLTGRISVFFKNRDGYGEILAPGPVQYTQKDVWAEQDYGVRGQLLYKPTDNMEWLLLAETGKTEISYGWPVRGLREPNNLNVDCPNPYTGMCVDALGEAVYGDTHPYGTIQLGLSTNTPKTTIASLQGTWTLGSVALTSITGFVDAKTSLVDHAAADYIPPGLFNAVFNDYSNQWSQEFRVASVGAQRFNWTTGVYVSTFTLTGPDSFSFSGSPGTTDTTRTSKNWAVYGQTDFAVTSSFKITAGLRYSDSQLSSGTTNLGGFKTHASDSWGDVGGRLILEEQFTESTLAYLSYNHGFKEGNVNCGIYGGKRPCKPMYVQPEFIDAYELGLKTDISHQYRVNADIFYNKLKDMQVAGTNPANFNFPTVTNAAKATTYGFELEVTARPVPDLLATLRYGYLHAQFDSYYVLSVLSPAPDFPAQVVNASGNPIPLAPENTFSAELQYTFHTGASSSVTPRVNYSYKSQQAFTPEGYTPRASQTGYGLLGAGLKFEFPQQFEVDVWGTNLTDKAYLVDSQPGDSFNGTDFLTYGQPRMYGVTLRKRF